MSSLYGRSKGSDYQLVEEVDEQRVSSGCANCQLPIGRKNLCRIVDRIDKELNGNHDKSRNPGPNKMNVVASSDEIDRGQSLMRL